MLLVEQPVPLPHQSCNPAGGGMRARRILQRRSRSLGHSNVNGHSSSIRRQQKILRKIGRQRIVSNDEKFDPRLLQDPWLCIKTVPHDGMQHF